MTSLVYHRHERNAALIDALLQVGSGLLEAEATQPSQVEWSLLEQQSDAALASPLLYGKREDELILIAGACVSAAGATEELLLGFNLGLKSIESIGYYGSPDIDTMLAQVVLREKYGLVPRLLRVSDAPEVAIASVDALLLRPAEVVQGFRASAMDVYDEWFDLTQLPFVREVFLAKEENVNPLFVEAVIKAGELLDTEALSNLESAMENHVSGTEISAIPPHYRYRFTDDAAESLRLFIQFAFFHGLHRDIPEFRVWEAPS